MKKSLHYNEKQDEPGDIHREVGGDEIGYRAHCAVLLDCQNVCHVDGQGQHSVAASEHEVVGGHKRSSSSEVARKESQGCHKTPGHARFEAVSGPQVQREMRTCCRVSAQRESQACGGERLGGLTSVEEETDVTRTFAPGHYYIRIC